MKLISRKLGRQNWYGVSDVDEDGKPLIILDPRMKSRKRLEIILHEMLHHVAPEWSETRVKLSARRMARVMNADRWRRVEA